MPLPSAVRTPRRKGVAFTLPLAPRSQLFCPPLSSGPSPSPSQPGVSSPRPSVPIPWWASGVRPSAPCQPRSPGAPGSASLAVVAAAAPRTAAPRPAPPRAPATAFVASAAARPHTTCPYVWGPGPRRPRLDARRAGRRAPVEPRSRRSPRAPETLRKRAVPSPRPCRALGVTWAAWVRRRDCEHLSLRLGTRRARCRPCAWIPRGSLSFPLLLSRSFRLRTPPGFSFALTSVQGPAATGTSWLCALQFGLLFQKLAEDTACQSGIRCFSGWGCRPNPASLVFKGDDGY